METDLAISEEALDGAILSWMQELSPHGICVTDTKLRIQGWNAWLQTNSGLAKENLLGQNLLKIFPDLKTRRLDSYFQKALAGEISVLSVAFHGHLFPFPPPLANSDFSNMQQTARIAPLLLEGEIVGTITIIEDVTEREFQTTRLRKQNEKQELFSWVLSHLLESTEVESMIKEIFSRLSAHLGVDAYFSYLWDDVGQKLLLHCTGGLSSALQERLATLKLGENISGACALEQRTILVSNVQQSQEKKASVAREQGFDACICHPLMAHEKLIGTLAFAMRGRNRFEDDEIEFTRIVAQYVAIALERSKNLNAIHLAQRELRNLAGTLEKTVEARTGELQESLSEMKSFSYSLAHDVRAPLRHIRGFAQVLLEDSKNELTPTSRNYIELILKAIGRLDSLTEDILAYSQLSQNAAVKTPVPLDDLLQDIISHHPNLSVPGVVTVKTPLHTPIAERPLLAQCLTNLLENASKFVAAGVKPQILIRTELKKEKSHDASESEWVRIFVEDNGIGIPAEFHSRIFGIFERLGAQSDFEGTGIGLAIVAKAMQRMGGRVGLSSETGQGTKFWIELPAQV